MTKYIHIHAKCDAWEIFKQVPEGKDVTELKKIRDRFKTYANYPGHGGRLVVNTKIVNPTLFSV